MIGLLYWFILYLISYFVSLTFRWIVIVFEVFRIFVVNCVITNMNAAIGYLIYCFSIFFRCYTDQAIVVQIQPQRLQTGYKNIESNIKLFNENMINLHGFIKVLDFWSFQLLMDRLISLRTLKPSIKSGFLTYFWTHVG